MAKQTQNPHAGHRARLRQDFLSAGLGGFQPHAVLEFLLFYSIPQGDTNVTAHRLLDHFGGRLRDVLDAPYEELLKVEGIGERSAVLIHFTAQLAKRYLEEQGEKKIGFDSTEALHRYAVDLFFGEKYEKAFLLCMDNAGRLNRSCPISLGTKYAVSLDNRTLLETAFRHGATKVVMAHNHPNGSAAPSKDDIACTEAAARLFRSVDIALLDHLIVAEGHCFSMAAHPRFGRFFLTNIASITDIAPLQKAADIT